MANINLSGLTLIHNTPWLKVWEQTFQDKEANWKQWSFVSRSDDPKSTIDKPDAVVIVPYFVYNTKNHLILTSEFRIPLRDYEIGFPAGLIDDGETVEEVAKRELREETGYIVKEIKKVSPPIYSSAGLTDESVVLVFVECFWACEKPSLESSEDITVTVYGQDEIKHILEHPCSGALKFGAKAWPIIDRFAETGKVI